MSFLYRNYKAQYPTPVPKTANPLRMGILGAANIAPQALTIPALSHSDVVITAVGARDKAKAEKFAKKYGIAKAYQGYDAVLQDPEIDAIYNPLPNGLHFEWTMKALAAGKHVLLEKPACNTEDEVKRVFAYAKEKNLIVLEAFHYRFHPANQRLKYIVDSGELGKLKSVTAHMCAPKGILKPDDIRFKYALGGGASMDVGAYTTSISRFLTGEDPVAVTSAVPILFNPEREPRIDAGMTYTLAFPSGITSDCYCHLSIPGWGPFGLIPTLDITVKVVGEEGEAELYLFVSPVVYHYLTVKTKKGSRTEKIYPRKGDEKAKAWGGDRGEPWWSTYRFQLEAFVDMCKGRIPQYWITPEDCVAQAKAIDMVYEKSGLGLRPNSTFAL